MKLNKVQAMDINQLDMVAGGSVVSPEVKEKVLGDVLKVAKKVKNLFKKLFS